VPLVLEREILPEGHHVDQCQRQRGPSSGPREQGRPVEGGPCPGFTAAVPIA
jgi:hypothetical protein